VHKILTFLFLAPILLWYTLCASAAEYPADDRLSRGMEAIKKGSYREALSLFESSEEEYTGQNDPSGIALSMLWKARVLATTGDGRKARAYFDKVVTMTEKGSTPRSGDIYFYRGAQALQEKDCRQARDDFKKALSLPEATIHRSLILLFHARACHDGGEYNMAYHSIEQALKEKGVPPFLETMLQCTRACNYGDLRQPQKALQAFQQALKMAEESSDPYLTGYVCYYMGRFYRNQGIDDDAAQYFKKAAAALQEPDSLALPDEAAWCPDLEKPLYESLLSLLIGQGREKEALYYCLQAREREIKKRFVVSQVFFQHMLPLLRSERHALTAADTAGPAAKLAELKKEPAAVMLSSFTARDEGALLFEGIDDWYQSILYRLDDRDLRLEFYVGVDTTFLWVLNGASLKTFVLPEGEKKLATRLREIHGAAADRQKKLTGLAAVLRIPDQLAGKEKILLGLHGILYSVPFAAIPDRAGTPLLQKVELCGIPPSLQKVESTRKKRLLVLCGQGNGSSSPAAEILAVAPSYSPRIIIEEQQVAPDRLKTAFDDCTMGHLASPWQLDHAFPDLSGIMTGKGFYSLFDFASSPGPMECAVVSRYEEIGENGSPGLPLLCHAFMKAGTGTVAVNTWTVPGEERVYLFGMFYKHIKNGFTPVSAFRNAQLAVKQQFPESPAWSYFTVVSGE
jgi:tetratricopeptide (TPR) repeat protein